MSLQEHIKEDLRKAMLRKDGKTKAVLRIIIGEFARVPNLPADKSVTDTQVIGILRKMISAETETKKAADEKGVPYEVDSALIDIVDGYLPSVASEEEILVWIKVNIDFSALKNRNQAMKPIMAHFGSRVEGGKVKQLLESMEDGGLRASKHRGCAAIYKFNVK
jgi:uncharacterized protein